MDPSKLMVKEFWNHSACGEHLYMIGEDLKSQFNNQLEERYRLEPMILEFVDFPHWKQKQVLEIGVGLGADHQLFASNGALLYGCDLTERAIIYTKQRLELFHLHSNLEVADANQLPYQNDIFELVYSWGVIHHSPGIELSIKEIHRVLKPGGMGKVMIYQKYSIVGFMLWIRYALFSGRPWLSMNEIYSRHMESPGTKAYTIKQAKKLFGNFSEVQIKTCLSHGDLLTSKAGQRHEGVLLSVARMIHPRWFIKKCLSGNGIFMLITVKK